RRVAELPSPAEDVGEGMARGLHRQSLPAARSHRYVKVDRVGGNPIHRTLSPPEAAADDADVRAIVIRDLRNIGGLYFLVSGRGHFQRRWQVRPQLKSVHPAS